MRIYINKWDRFGGWKVLKWGVLFQTRIIVIVTCAYEEFKTFMMILQMIEK